MMASDVYLRGQEVVIKKFKHTLFFQIKLCCDIVFILLLTLEETSFLNGLLSQTSLALQKFLNQLPETTLYGLQLSVSYDLHCPFLDPHQKLQLSFKLSCLSVHFIRLFVTSFPYSSVTSLLQVVPNLFLSFVVCFPACIYFDIVILYPA